jgi:ribosome recycling factor
LYDIGINFRRSFLMDKELFKPIEEKMNKTINVLKDNLAGIRAGRANPAVLDKITIDYYGTPTPINQVASVSVPHAPINISHIRMLP